MINLLKKTFPAAVTFALIIFLSPIRAQTADAVKYTIDNCVNEFQPDKTVKTDAGYQYWLPIKNLRTAKH